MDELVTVITPVYNKRNHIERCVASITGQTYSSLQIILVDDGSTDGSGEICDALAEMDARIEVVHQPNGGVSAARNAGLRLMRGAWLAFVDADDYVSPYYLEDMLVAKVGCDMVVCCYLLMQEDKGVEEAAFRRLSHSERITGYQASVRRFNNHALYISCCFKLFRSYLWNGLSFPEGRIAEDLFVSHTLLYRSNYVAVTDAVLYAYVQSEGSLNRGEFSERRLDALDSWEEGVRFFIKSNEPELANIAKRVYCSRVFDARCICKARIPHKREILRQLNKRASDAYREAKAIRSYIDISRRRALAYRALLFLGRWCSPVYGFLFVRDRWRSQI